MVKEQRPHRNLYDRLMGAEREDMWRTLREVWPKIDTYQRRAGREVPVFRLLLPD